MIAPTREESLVPEEFQVKKIEHIIAASPGEDAIYMVQTSYWETDAGNAVGMILRSGWGRDERYETDLSTNNQLRNLWSTTKGSLWVGSTDGNVWTTAGVPWGDSPPDTEYEERPPKGRWKVMKLPSMQGFGFKPILTAVWGTSDEDVHFGTFKGGLYHWEGRGWVQACPEVRSCINHIHGSATDDVYAVGEDGLILHWDGHVWRRLPYPGDGTDGLTGVRALDRDESFICGRSGRILHGNRSGFEVLGEFRAPFYGISHFRGRLILAAGDAGVWELLGNRTAVLKDTIATVGVFELKRILAFVEPAQEPASLVEFDPEADSPWWRRSY
jgi:hypothetical protein